MIPHALFDIRINYRYSIIENVFQISIKDVCKVINVRGNLYVYFRYLAPS